MADFKPLAGISQEDTLSLMLIILAEIRDKLPRTDNFDRLIINPSEVGPPAIAIGSGNLSSLQTLGLTARPADVIPFHLSNVGVQHIYNMITVT